MLIDGSDCASVTRKHRYGVRWNSDEGRWRVSCLVAPEAGRWAPAFGRCPAIEEEFPQGGAFWVNEWNQIWRWDEARRAARCIGEFPALHLRFELPASSRRSVQSERKIYDGGRCEALRAGSEWTEHEAGMKYRYNLPEGRLWRNVLGDGVERKEMIEAPSSSLLGALKAARPDRQSGRFYVNEHGVVFLPSLENRGSPVFVGQIDVNSVNWFPKPDGSRLVTQAGGEVPGETKRVLDLLRGVGLLARGLGLSAEQVRGALFGSEAADDEDR